MTIEVAAPEDEPLVSKGVDPEASGWDRTHHETHGTVSRGHYIGSNRLPCFCPLHSPHVTDIWRNLWN